MDDNSPFSAAPPAWVQAALHATHFCCPSCGHTSQAAQAVWINRRSPVYVEGLYRRKWQEFYQCDCGTSWWGWSSDRTPPAWLQARNAEAADGSTDDE